MYSVYVPEINKLKLVINILLTFTVSDQFSSSKRSILKSISSVLLALGALGISEDPKRISARWLFFSICLFGAIVYWSYNAILVSLLTVDFFVLPIQTLNDLLVKDQVCLKFLIIGVQGFNITYL